MAIPMMGVAIVVITVLAFFSFLGVGLLQRTNPVRGIIALSQDLPTQPVQTQLVVSPATFDLGSGQSTTLTATLTTAEDVPLADKVVSWYFSLELGGGSGTTDGSGQVSIPYTAPVTDSELWDTITVTFAGDDQYQGSSGYSTGHILPRVQTQVAVSPSSFTLQSGGSRILTATLTAEDVPLAGKTISLSAGLGEVSPEVGVTDNSGNVSFTYTTKTTDYALWDNIHIWFNGDNQYKESFGASIVHVTVLDSDNDNMSDTWENKYGLDPENFDDAGQDKDGDGYTNVQEYWAMTDPNLSSSYPGSEEEQPGVEGGLPSTEGIFLVVAGALVAVGLIGSVVLIGAIRERAAAISILVDNGLVDMRIKEVDIFRKIRELEEFTIPDIMRETKVSKVLVWRTVRKLSRKGLVRPTEQQKPGSNGKDGRGKPSTVYKYVGK